ncbi:CiV19.5g2-like-2 protein [Chelonus insularis]|nr:CiV19.5g2-like-2 protein [Chelonus insularis]
MDSVNTHEYRMKIAKKILKVKKELKELDPQIVNESEEHPIHGNQYIIKLLRDKKRLQAELQFMCRKIVMLNDELIEALKTD